ncbi:MAG: Hsp70 family protein [Bacteroidia bacterium]|nr:Hsp70 family protein [Bacteroidia bacterium]
MGRNKIDYGIDLGTTNSAIARMENGEVKIIKSDIQKDTTPSCVYFKKNTIIVGDTAYNRFGDERIEAFKNYSLSGKKQYNFNTFIEFKRTMGTDKTEESISANRTYNSEELSAEVLKALKNYVRDEEFSSVVITVPARFRNNQIDATQKAAELSGFNHCELLMEPIAASIAYGVNAKTVNGYWLVFDFGGGTFDAALMRVEEGIMKVVDTDGDNHLGGKDLDTAIVDNIIIPYLKANYKIDKILSDEYGKSSLRDALKSIAEEAKIDISSPSKVSNNISTKPIGEDDDGNEIDFEIKMSLGGYEKAFAPIFQRAIDISLKLLKKNNLDSSNLEMVLLVGGPTLSQTLRKMLKEQLKTKIDTSIDPMTSIAVGAALFASSIDIPPTFQKRDKEKIQLILKYPNNTVESGVDLGIKIDRTQTKGDIPNIIFVEISRKDKGWSSGKVEIIDDVVIISLLLSIGKSNGFEINIFDEKGSLHPCEPSIFNIIQGFVQPSATLSFHLGIAAFTGDSENLLLNSFLGLEKNKSLPAKGKKEIYKTQKDIRPNNAEDKIRIPIYEGEPNTRAILNEIAGNVLISGEEFNKFLPKGSDVEITLSQDASRGITLTLYFPDIDETIERKIEKTVQSEYDADEMENEIEKSKNTLSKLESDSLSDDSIESKNLRSELNELKDILVNGKANYDTKIKVMERLRLALIELDKIETAGQFPKVEEELNNALSNLKVTNQKFGNIETTKAFEQFQILANDAIKNENIQAAKELTSQIKTFDYSLVDAGAGVALDISYIKYFDDDFENFNWKNKNQAKLLINQAKQIISTNPTRQKLKPIISDLFKLLPDSEKPPRTEKDDEFLTK